MIANTHSIRTPWAHAVALAVLTSACSNADPVPDLDDVGVATGAVSQATIDQVESVIDGMIDVEDYYYSRRPALCVGYIASGTQFNRVCTGQTRRSSASEAAYPPATTVANDETIFRIGSLSKLFTGSYQAMRRLDANSLSGGCSNASALCYNEKLVDHITYSASQCTQNCTRKGNITLLQLANHTAGLAKNGTYFSGTPYDEALLFDDFEQIAVGPPNVYEYSNIGFALLSQALESGLSGQFVDHVETRLLGPLGMVDTMGDVSGLLPRIAQDVGGQVGADDAWGPAFTGSAGYWSNLDDMMEFLRWHLGFVSVPSIDPIVDESVNNRLGWGVTYNWDGSGATLVGKNGAANGYQAYIGYLRGTEKGVVILLAEPTYVDPQAFGEYILEILR
jgi:CubicO group peptidase (beta-lactamase class C family)